MIREANYMRMGLIPANTLFSPSPVVIFCMLDSRVAKPVPCLIVNTATPETFPTIIMRGRK